MARLYKKGPPKRAFQNNAGRCSVLDVVGSGVGLVGNVLRSVGGRLGSVGGGTGGSGSGFVGGSSGSIGGLVHVGTHFGNGFASGGGSGLGTLLGSINGGGASRVGGGSGFGGLLLGFGGLVLAGRQGQNGSGGKHEKLGIHGDSGVVGIGRYSATDEGKATFTLKPVKEKSRRVLAGGSFF
jgi:hypothetical protein